VGAGIQPDWLLITDYWLLITNYWLFALKDSLLKSKLIPQGYNVL
jgi:hypothetical protein